MWTAAVFLHEEMMWLICSGIDVTEMLSRTIWTDNSISSSSASAAHHRQDSDSRGLPSLFYIWCKKKKKWCSESCSSPPSILFPSRSISWTHSHFKQHVTLNQRGTGRPIISSVTMGAQPTCGWPRKDVHSLTFWSHQLSTDFCASLCDFNFWTTVKVFKPRCLLDTAANVTSRGNWAFETVVTKLCCI